jgi:thiosulfate reductase cytochrome b subunit
MSTTGPAQLPLAAPILSSNAASAAQRPRHALTVRVTHWIAAACFFALLLSGVEILLSHPRFYWGEAGNDLTTPLFQIPVPSSRDHVPTGYSYVLPDQNGWSRALHFQSAWLVVITGLVYVLFGVFAGHFRRELIPARDTRSWRSITQFVAHHLRFKRPDESEAWSYNVLQRLAYLSVVFVLFPLIIWTGLAMSPSFTSAIPSSVILLGGRQSARTLHFFVSSFLVIFLAVHVVMVWRAGFWSRVRSMITGRPSTRSERI